MCKLCALHFRYLHAIRFTCIGNVISVKMYEHVVLKSFRNNLVYIIVIGAKFDVKINPNSSFYLSSLF